MDSEGIYDSDIDFNLRIEDALSEHQVYDEPTPTHSDNLYSKTSKYFMETLSRTSKTISLSTNDNGSIGDTNEAIDTTTSNEIESYSDAINLLEFYMSKAIRKNWPPPIFGWIMMINDDDFHDLIRKKHFFALRILYFYSSICYMSRFYLYGNRNLWIDYIHWFRKFNFKSFEGEWNCEHDQRLYSIMVFHNFSIDRANYESIGIFDPNILYRQECF